jgi:hypothetical protein
MNGSEIKEIRTRLGLGRTEFALLIGYVGNDRNNNLRVRRLEAEEQAPLYLARYLWLIERWVEEHGALPAWPDHLRIEGEERPWT